MNVPRHDMVLVVPYVLSARRLVVLANGVALAAERLPQYDGEALGCIEHGGTDRRWHGVDVLDVQH